MSRESAFILDDGSLSSKVLQFELATSYDITTIKMPDSTTVETWKKDFEEQVKILIGQMKGIIKIFLPYAFEDYLTKDIRTQMMEIQHKYPNIRIIPWYEQASKDSIKHRAANYGIMADVKPELGRFRGESKEYMVEFPKREYKLLGEAKEVTIEAPKGGVIAITDRARAVIEGNDEYKKLIEQIESKPKEKGLGQDITEQEEKRLRDLDVQNIASDVIHEVEGGKVAIDQPDDPKPVRKARKKKSEYFGNA